MTLESTAVIQKKGNWYVAWVEEIPGVNTQGKTLAEARRNLKDALRLILREKPKNRWQTKRKCAPRYAVPLI